MSQEIIEHLESNRVSWTSIDIVRIGYEEDSVRPVILWIGVQPESLSIEEGNRVARSCKQILVKSGIIDVDVEMRESVVRLL